MTLFARGLKLSLATLEALPQVNGSVRLFSEPGLQVALKVFELEKLSNGVAQVHEYGSRWFSRSKARR
jgi:hypothetical protein